MIYITITYNPRDAAKLPPAFTMLQSQFMKIPTKKCLSMIQGLTSRSFEFPNGIQANRIQS